MSRELDEIAARQMASVMQGLKAPGSVFTDDGQLDPGAAARYGSQGGSMGLGEYLDMGAVPFPGDVEVSLTTPGGSAIGAKVPFNGDHAMKLAWLVKYLASMPHTDEWGGPQGGPYNDHDQRVLHAAAILYSIGGVKAGGAVKGLHGYAVNAEKSAGMASELLHSGIGAGTYWNRSDVRDDVCRIILQHGDPEKVRSDPRLQIFVDALRFELCRIDENCVGGGTTGHRVLQAFLSKHEQPKFFIGWSRSRENLLAWMRSVRGWK